MLIERLRNLFASSREFDGARPLTSQESVAVPEEMSVPARPIIDAQCEDPEVVVLAQHVGPIIKGQVIEVTLQEMLEWLPRVRRRKDAYTRLEKTLLNTYGVKLIIKSRKDGKMGKR